MPKRKNTERQQSRLAKQQRQCSPSPPDLSTIASSSRRGFRAPSNESSDLEPSAKSPHSPEYHSQPSSPPPWAPPLPPQPPSPMSGETLTAEQVLQALAGLTDKVGDAFLTIKGLVNKTTKVADRHTDT